MGSKRFRTINDFARFRQGIEVRCACGHVAVLDERAVCAKFQQRHWPKGIEVAINRFRCRRCGGRPDSIGPLPRD